MNKLEKKVDNMRLYIKVREKLLNINFDEDKHVYKHSKTGKVYGGCSTIAGITRKPWLTPWALKKMEQDLMSNWDLRKKYNSKEKKELLKDAKKASKKYTQKSADRGTIIHYCLEKWCKEGNMDNIQDDFESPDIDTGDLKELSTEDIPEVIEDHEEALKGFKNWFEERDVYTIESELIVADHEHCIAGTLDLICFYKDNDGIHKVALVDFKTSNIVGKSAFLQTAGYKMMLQKMGINPQIRIILQLSEADNKYNEPFNEIIIPEENYEFEKECFLSQNTIRRYESYFENKIKSKI